LEESLRFPPFGERLLAISVFLGLPNIREL